MKNRINRSFALRFFICIILFSALLSSEGAENIPHNNNNKVKILTLSKHLRLLKEGGVPILNFSLPDGGELVSGDKRVPLRKLSISFADNIFSIKSDQINSVNGDCTIYPKENGDTFSIKLNGEERSYPLPLHIKYSDNQLELSIDETLNQFAIDSAWGELGDTGERESEALYALAHLIKARCALPYLMNKHKGYDFCDLTCCQTYKGRSGKIFDDPVSIDTANLRNGLFFHSSSGGTLFTESVFNSGDPVTKAPRDVIYSEDLTLSSEKFRLWNASITESELSVILYRGRNISLNNIIFDREKEILLIGTGNGSAKLSPETFRLTVNRVKGWNFLKSNNYSITKTGEVYKFSGSGLGHGTGMSFEGAIQLAQKGYSRCEILEHYYPQLRYNTESAGVNFRLQYIVFNSDTGGTIQCSSGPSFRNRIIPCGSIFKLFIALYLAERRTDLFNNYTYSCTGKEKDKLMPELCWDKTGHGKMDIRNALSHSCNKFFASLYSRIEMEDFRSWLAEFISKQGIELIIPPIKSRSAFSIFLAGLNFNLTITVDGLIKLNRFIYMQNRERSSEEIEIIYSALHKTFTIGTAKESAEQTKQKNILKNQNLYIQDLWGKTGTVIAGTNNHHGYGIFTGGVSSIGIVAILRKGTGAMTAGECAGILLKADSIISFQH